MSDNHMSTLLRLEAMHDEAIRHLVDARRRLAELTMAQYVTAALEDYPDATHIVFWVSDQGGEDLWPQAIHAGDTIVSEDAVELEDIAHDLFPGNEGIWMPFMEAHNNRGGDYALVIEWVLDAYGDDPFVPTPVRRAATS